jgi:hypothetical protein
MNFDWLTDGGVAPSTDTMAFARLLGDVAAQISPEGSVGRGLGRATSDFAGNQLFSNAVKTQKAESNNKHAAMMNMFNDYLSGDDDFEMPSEIKATGDNIIMKYPSMKAAEKAKKEQYDFSSNNQGRQNNQGEKPPEQVDNSSYLNGLKPEEIMALSQIGNGQGDFNSLLNSLVQARISEKAGKKGFERTKNLLKIKQDYKDDADKQSHEYDKELYTMRDTAATSMEAMRMKNNTTLAKLQNRLSKVKTKEEKQKINAEIDLMKQRALLVEAEVRHYGKASDDVNTLAREKVFLQEKRDQRDVEKEDIKQGHEYDDIIFDGDLSWGRRTAAMSKANRSRKGSTFYYKDEDGFDSIEMYDIPEDTYIDVDGKDIKLTKAYIRNMIKQNRKETPKAVIEYLQTLIKE